MREIKFRAFSKRLNRMLTSRIIKQSSDSLVKIINEIMPGLDCKKGVFIPTEDTDLEIMQYTGLKDKNGTEIYEGDIVEYKVKGMNKTCKTIMKFNEEHGAFLFGIYEGVKMPCGKKTRMNKYTRKSVGSVEVIGNIYENPELLEGN